jgi:hypothetical protein
MTLMTEQAVRGITMAHVRHVGWTGMRRGLCSDGSSSYNSTLDPARVELP